MDTESFYFKGAGSIYEVIPEDDGIYTIFKDGIEHLQLTHLNRSKWVRIDYKTDLPVIEDNEEVEAIGRVILKSLNKEK